MSREGVLLRTLGATRRQLVQIQFVEYAILGGLAAVCAVTLLTGWIANRGIADHPPLAVLRQET